jgi:hypothetical protein
VPARGNRTNPPPGVAELPPRNRHRRRTGAEPVE